MFIKKTHPVQISPHQKQKKALAQKIEPMPILYPSVFLGIFQSPPLQSGVGLY